MIKKADWVMVSITGDPELAKEIKGFIDLVLDWKILEWDQLLKARPFLKDQVKEAKGGLVFGLARRLKRPIGQKAGFHIEKRKSEDKKKL